jgi:RNA-directed DNA polymerase
MTGPRPAGADPSRAATSQTAPAEPDDVMEEALQPENLNAACRRVMANAGAPGVDGMTVRDLEPWWRQHGERRCDDLRHGRYRPAPVRRVRIPKPDGGERELGIPTVVDRIVQQALAQALQRRLDPTFSPHRYGFRPGRSAHQAVAAAQGLIAEGRRWVVDLDLEKFFDRVNHDRLMARLAARIQDRRVLKLVRAFLEAGALDGGLESATTEGTPQGGPLSPLLSNVVLDELDQELQTRGLAFVRYADDCNIYVRSESAATRVMASVTRFVGRKLRLKVNASKSAADRPHRRKFLGFSFTSHRPPKRRIAPPARTRFQERVRKLTRRRLRQPWPALLGELNQYLRGWRGYFGFCQTPSALAKLDDWVQARLRAWAWQSWGTSRRRFRQLALRGTPPALAGWLVRQRWGPWRMAHERLLRRALPREWFWTRGGLVRLSPTR